MRFNSNNKNNSNGTSTRDIIAANVQALTEQLEAGHSEALTNYLTAMAHFHTYSFGNILMIAAQKPSASHVAGIRTWNQLGRRVKRGEKGIMIFAPMIGKRTNATAEKTAKGKRTRDTTDAKTENTETLTQLVGFRPVYVWDILQTEGDDLPAPASVKGDASNQLERLVGFVEAQGIKLEYSERIAPARGMSYGGLIRLLPGMDGAETFSTLVHELSHEMLHKAERRMLTTKTVRETEAEAVAFVVSKAIGLDTGSAAADYINLYHGNAELLQESLEIVQRTAAVILGAISPEVTETAEAGKAVA